jgi:hypothetical protein
MGQLELSTLWQSAAAFAMTASFACLLLLLTKHRGHLRNFRWIPPVLLCVTLLAGGLLLMFPNR